MEPWMWGYHYCKDPEKLGAFVDSGELVMARKSSWLGPGMYFWDNLGNAKYWRKRRNPKGGLCDTGVVRARIDLGDMLDLTDPDMIEAIVPVGIEIEKGVGASLGKKLTMGLLVKYLFGDEVPDSYPPGVRRWLEWFREWLEPFKVIRILGHYSDMADSARWLSGLVARKRSRLDFSGKIILCVRDGSAVHSPEFVNA